MADDAGFEKVDHDAGFEKTSPDKNGTVSPPGVVERLKTGFMDPVYGAAQIGARMAPEGAIPTDFEEYRKDLEKTVDTNVSEREKAYRAKQKNDGVDWARLAGSVANPLQYVGLLGGAPGAAIGGAMGAVLAPEIDTANFIAHKAKESLFGAAFGTAATVGGTALGKTISPLIGKAAQELMSRGVQLTPGQLAGGILRRAEEAAKSFPILGSFIRGAEGRSIESFNKSVVDQAMEPIGEKLPSVITAGRSAIDYAHGRISKAYDDLLPKMNFTLDNQFATDMANIRLLAGEMPKQNTKQFETILKNRVEQRMPNGTMDGKSLKAVESDLTRLVADFKHSSDAGQRQLGERLDEVRGTLRSALERQNPDAAPVLQKINSAYAMFARVEGAAARRATSQGIFTPTDLLATIKSSDKTARKGAFARGDALMQEYAEFGQSLLPNKMPDSGTTERALWDMLGIGTAVVKPEIPAALFAASLPYTKAGTAAVSKIANPGPTRKAIGGAVQSASPFAAPAAGAAGSDAFGGGT